jgi:hypothetical protein
MKKTFFIFLLSFAYASSFSQTLSKDETVEYIKTKLTKSAYYYRSCNDGTPCIDYILDVECIDSKLFITIDYTYVDDAGTYQSKPVEFTIVLGDSYIATPTSDCSNLVYDIGAIKLIIDKADAESLVKAINYLGTICVDPFK